MNILKDYDRHWSLTVTWGLEITGYIGDPVIEQSQVTAVQEVE